MLCLPTSLTPSDVTLEIGRSSVPIIKQTTFHGFFLNAGSAKNIKTLTPPYMTNPSFFPDPQTKIKKKVLIQIRVELYKKKIAFFWVKLLSIQGIFINYKVFVSLTPEQVTALIREKETHKSSTTTQNRNAIQFQINHLPIQPSWQLFKMKDNN